jgi:hypothetical protein
VTSIKEGTTPVEMRAIYKDFNPPSAVSTFTSTKNMIFKDVKLPVKCLDFCGSINYQYVEKDFMFSKG